MNKTKVNLSIKFKYLALNFIRAFLYLFNFVSGACRKVYNFFLFMHLNALFVRRLNDYDLKVVPEINKLKTDTFGDWFEQLELSPKHALLTIALDPKSAQEKATAKNNLLEHLKKERSKMTYGVVKRYNRPKLQTALEKVDAQIKEIKDLEKPKEAATTQEDAQMLDPIIQASKVDFKARMTNKINSDHQMPPDIKERLLKQIEEAWMLDPKDYEKKE